MTILNEDYLLRRVPFHWVRDDGTILEDAYRPSDRDMYSGVSIGLERKIRRENNLRWFNCQNKYPTCICKMLIGYTRKYGYDCIQKPKNKSLGLIIGDMLRLRSDIQILFEFASKSEIIFNPPPHLKR